MLQSAEILGPEGPFARQLEHFAPREQQQQMADAIQQAIDGLTTLVVEAGTGTGKTFAYLVPAIMSREKIIISTGTKNLQDQLYHRDIPAVRDILKVPFKSALLKGRANYLCQYRLDVALLQGRLRSRQQASYLQAVREWSGRTETGDIAECHDVPEQSLVWPMVTSTVENCLGSDCPSFSDCHVMTARRRAQEADIVVVNHHLFFADIALKEGGYAELLPGANAFILDEAHTLPEVATQFFGLSVSGRQLKELTRDTMAEHLSSAGDMQSISSACDALDKSVDDLRLALGRDIGRFAWRRIQNKPSVRDGLLQLRKRLNELIEWLEMAAVRSKGLDSCWRRAQGFDAGLDLLTEKEHDDHIQWLDVHKRSFVFYLTPLNIASQFNAQMQAYPCAWIFTSATLAVKDAFTHFAGRMGLEQYQALRFDSPFDYREHAMLAIPPQMPDPNSDDYTATVVDRAIPLIEASRGRTFMLFTSHRALQQAERLLRDRTEYPLYVQGQMPRDLLLASFREAGNAVLMGTSSFWEGVDVRGEALSLVVIDKLPFASPGDPVLQARIDQIKASGQNAFVDFQLPNAVITLKQGVGRLIRDVSDKGVMMICDPRLVTKGYGKVFLNSLPPMRQVRDPQQAADFLASI